MTPMPFPAGFTPEQNAVMIITVEEGYLNEVITHYGARLRWAETGSTRNPCALDEEQQRALIPVFTAVVTDLIERDLIEIREPVNGVWDDAPPLTPTEVEAVLADPTTWIWNATDPDQNRMVMLMTTDHGDQVIGR